MTIRSMIPPGRTQVKRGDLIVFYSPKSAIEGGEPLQSFTALGRVADDEPYQAEVTPTFRPWRGSSISMLMLQAEECLLSESARCAR